MSELVTKRGESRHPDFVKIYKQFVKRHGEEDGARYYYLWLNHLGLDDAKSYGSQASFEAFNWAAGIIQWLKDEEDSKLYKCEAIFPLTSMNDRVYTEDELLRGTRTLVDKPVNLNHERRHPIDGINITGAEYEGECAECILSIKNDAESRRGHNIQNMIDTGEIWNVSVEWKPTQLHGKGLVFTGLALLTKDTLPGVPMARIYSVESLVKKAEKAVEALPGCPCKDPVDVGEPYPNEHSCRIRSPTLFKKGSFRRIKRGNLSMILGRLKGQTTMTLQAYRYPKGDWTADRARAHCKRHNGSFEPASEEFTIPLHGGIIMTKENEKVEKLAKRDLEISELKRKIRKLETEKAAAIAASESKDPQINEQLVKVKELEKKVAVLKGQVESTGKTLKETIELSGKASGELAETKEVLRNVRALFDEEKKQHEATSVKLKEETTAHYENATNVITLTRELTKRNNEVLGLQDAVTKEQEKQGNIKQEMQKTIDDLAEKLRKVKRAGKIIVKI